MDDKHLPIATLRATRLHPAIYKILIALTLWLLAAIWGFAAHGYSGITLVVVTLFLLVSISLVAVLWRISRRGRDRGLDTPAVRRTIGTWLRGDLDTWQGRLKGSEAATQVILPIAAAAVAMTALVIVLHFDLMA